MAPFRLSQKRALTDRIAEFCLASDAGEIPDWPAGAHVDVVLGDLGHRSYSLIRFPREAKDALKIAVQSEPDGQGGSRAMHALDSQASLEISAPKNSFALVDDPAPVALIAGGIGVTPLISMATDLAEAGRRFVFHYAGRSRDQMAYVEALEQCFGPQLTCYYDDAGGCDLTALAQSLTGHHVYICGPKGMIEATRQAAEGAGIPASHIHIELFATPQAEAEDAAFDVEIASTGDVVTVPPGQSIIDVLEAAGYDLIYDCQRGDCGICQVDVLEGTPDHRDVVLSAAEKASNSVMQICVSRAKSPRLKLDL